MSRHHPHVFALAALFAAAALFLLAAGCGGESEEEALEKATAAVATDREAVQKARETVDAKQQAVDEAQKELEAAKSELRVREQALREAESRVGRKATDTTLFRSVQRRLLDEEELEDLAIAVRVANGVVSLQGAVADGKDRERAEKIARETPGVVNVDNRIEVVSPPAEQ